MNAALTTPFEVPGAVEVETAATRRADHQRGRVIKACTFTLTRPCVRLLAQSLTLVLAHRQEV